MMHLEDDRTDAQRKTHTVLVIGTDKGMSGWGMASGGTSYAAWACEPDCVMEVVQWVERRGDMLRVRVASGQWRPRGVGHAHIYVADRATHASLVGARS